MNINHILYLSETGETIRKEPMIFSRLYKEGQSLVMNYQAYEVLKVTVVEDVQRVVLKPCNVCRKCGGIAGKKTEPDECVCL